MKVVRSYAVTWTPLDRSLYAWKECDLLFLLLLSMSGDEAGGYARLYLQMKTGALTLEELFLSK